MDYRTSTVVFPQHIVRPMHRGGSSKILGDSSVRGAIEPRGEDAKKLENCHVVIQHLIEASSTLPRHFSYGGSALRQTQGRQRRDVQPARRPGNAQVAH